MTTKDLRTLIDNLDEYIHIPGGIERLRKAVLYLAISGQLTPRNLAEGTGEELHKQLQAEKRTLIAQGKLKSQRPSPEISDNEIPFNIPSTWKWARLSEVTYLITDGTHHTPHYKSQGVPFLSIKDISAGSLDFSNCKYISVEEHSEINQRCNPEIGDILFCRIGTLGRPVIVDTKKPFSIFVSLGLIKFNQGLLIPEFLKLYLEAPQTYKQYSEIMAGGSHTNKLNLASMKNLLTVLPPKIEQEQIVKRVGVIYELIEELAKKYAAEQSEREKLVTSSLASLSSGSSETALAYMPDIIRTHSDARELRKAILRLAVSGKLVPQDYGEGTGEELHQQIQAEKQQLIAIGKLKKQKPLSKITNDEILFQIPQNWKWIRLGDLTNMQNGYAFKSSQWRDKGLPIVRIQNLNNHSAPFNYVNVEDVDSKYLIDDEQTLLSWSGTPGTSFGVFIWNRGQAALNQHIFKCDVLGVNKDYFKIVANEAIYSQLGSAHGGVGLKHLTKTQLDALPLQIPPLAEQNRIVAKTTQLLDLVDKFELALETPRLAVPAVEEIRQIQQATVKQGVAAPSDEVSELSKQQKKVQRKMLACFVANESLDGSQLGKTKFEKLLHLVEYHVLKRDLNQRYSVQPAGPYDGGFTRTFWDDVIKSKWFKIEGYGNLQKIVAGDKHEKSQKDYGYLSNDEKNEIRDLIKMFSKWGYAEAEIISTLYAAWNNRLIKGEEVSDDFLKQDFLQWDPQKTQHSDRLDRALAWMRQNNIIPDGWGNEIKRAKSNAKTVQ